MCRKLQICDIYFLYSRCRSGGWAVTASSVNKQWFIYFVVYFLDLLFKKEKLKYFL